jgi:hypothetical protein
LFRDFRYEYHKIGKCQGLQGVNKLWAFFYGERKKRKKAVNVYQWNELRRRRGLLTLMATASNSSCW